MHHMIESGADSITIHGVKFAYYDKKVLTGLHQPTDYMEHIQHVEEIFSEIPKYNYGRKNLTVHLGNQM